MTTSHSKSPNACQAERQSKPQANPCPPLSSLPYGRGWAKIPAPKLSPSRGSTAQRGGRTETPKQISRFLDLVRCESLRDFLHPEKMTRIKNMPFWILADEQEQTMWFDHVTPDLSKEELLRYIRSGLIYIRRADAKAKDTLANINNASHLERSREAVPNNN